MKRRSNNR